MTSTSVFDAIHDDRPERLAQLLLAHALKTEFRLQRYLNIGPKPTVRVECHDDESGRGWRPDIVVRTKERRLLRVEVKVRARLTPEQVRAFCKNRGLLLVVSTDRREHFRGMVSPGHRIETWATLATKVSDESTRSLLQEADVARTALQEEIDLQTASAELDVFAEAGGRHMGADVWVPVRIAS